MPKIITFENFQGLKAPQILSSTFLRLEAAVSSNKSQKQPLTTNINQLNIPRIESAASGNQSGMSCLALDA